jgi:phage shock protein C
VAERLYRSRDERMIAGIAGGMADTLDVDPTLVRIGWVVFALVTGGAAILLYFVLLFVIPEEPYGGGFAPGGDTMGTTEHPGPATTAEPGTSSLAPQTFGDPSTSWRDARRAERTARRAERRAARGGGDSTRSGALILGLILVALGAWFLLRRYLPQIDTGVLWPYALVALGILLIVVAMGRGARPRR